MSKIDEAHQASAVLQFPGFAQAFKSVREAYLATISDPKTSDDTAQAIRARLLALNDVRMDLECAVNTGKLELHQIARIEKRKNSILRKFY